MQVDYPPNQPILIAKTMITSVDGQQTSLQAEVVQELWPRQRFLIKSQDLPPNLVNHPFCRITLGCSNALIDVHLAVYSIGALMNTEKLKGSLVPNEYPCLAVSPDTLLESAELAIVNFNKFYGSTDEWIDDDNSSNRVGVAKIEGGPWLIKLTAVRQIDTILKSLESEGGRSITHVASIRQVEGGLFLAADLGALIKSLRAFLSFVLGANCGIISLHGADQNGNHIPVRWGMESATPWSRDRSLLLTVGGGDDLRTVFSGFYRSISDGTWGENIFNAIDWYVHSNEAPFHVGIVLSQTSLEVLSNSLIEKTTRRRLRAAARIQEGLSRSKIPAAIPPAFGDLEKFAHSKNLKSGPEVLACLRNYLVHGNLQSRKLPSRVVLEAHELCQWYIEMLLLRKFGYEGRYQSRIVGTRESSISEVPWARNRTTA